MALKYEIYQDEANEWRWRLKAANGKLLSGPQEGYKRLLGCIENILLHEEGRTFNIPEIWLETKTNLYHIGYGDFSAQELASKIRWHLKEENETEPTNEDET